MIVLIKSNINSIVVKHTENLQLGSRKLVDFNSRSDIHATNYADTFDTSGFDCNSRYQNA